MVEAERSGFDPVPETVEELIDPLWLSAALDLRHHGCRVKSVDVVTHTRTIASKVRLDLTFVDPGSPPAPRFLCAKGYFGNGASLGGAGGPEAHFYRELAASAGPRVPECHYIGVKGENELSVLLLEDLGRPSTELRTALTPFNPDESAATLEQLARLHAGSWGRGSFSRTG